MMDESEPRQNTVGIVAARLGVPTHVVDYFARTRGVRGSRAGIARVFSESDVEFLRREIEANRYGHGRKAVTE
jgi:DNA-binding transcriptional MerR regulator